MSKPHQISWEFVIHLTQVVCIAEGRPDSLRTNPHILSQGHWVARHVAGTHTWPQSITPQYPDACPPLSCKTHQGACLRKNGWILLAILENKFMLHIFLNIAVKNTYNSDSKPYMNTGGGGCMLVIPTKGLDCCGWGGAECSIGNIDVG